VAKAFRLKSGISLRIRHPPPKRAEREARTRPAAGRTVKDRAKCHPNGRFTDGRSLWQHSSAIPCCHNGEPCNGSPLHGETSLYPIGKWLEKPTSITQGNAPGSKQNTHNAAMSDGLLLPLECGGSVRIFSKKVLKRLLISRRLARMSAQHCLHMVLDGLLIGLRSALRRLGHPTLLHPAVRAWAGWYDNRLFGKRPL
jgi:hypothetical protein